MTDYSPAEAAKRAGVEPEYVERLLALGIARRRTNDRLTRGDVRRILMARTLEQAGMPLEALASAIGVAALTLDFMDTPMYERFATLGDETFQQLAERTGIPLHLLGVVREATGAAAPLPDDRVREDELPIVDFVAEELRLGFRETSIERALRVLGESLRRVAETESNAWRSDMLESRIARGMSMQEAAAEANISSETLDGATDRTVLAVWHAQQARAWTANIIAGFERALQETGVHRPIERLPAIAFLDITGYTRFTQERGDEAAASLAERLGRVVTRPALERGGRAVKWLGDGVMFYFPDPARGVLAALDMVEGVRSADLPPAHVGLHAGPILFQEGDYFGQTVNLASRIADYARPGEVLVSQSVVDVALGGEGLPAVRFSEIGPVELKGMSSPIQLHAAHRSGLTPASP